MTQAYCLDSLPGSLSRTIPICLLLVKFCIGQNVIQTAQTTEPNLNDENNWRIKIEEEKTKRLITYISAASIILALFIICTFIYLMKRSRENLRIKLNRNTNLPAQTCADHHSTLNISSPHSFVSSGSSSNGPSNGTSPSGSIDGLHQLRRSGINHMKCNLKHCTKPYCKKRTLPRRPTNDIRFIETKTHAEGAIQKPDNSNAYFLSPNNHDQPTRITFLPYEEIVTRKSPGRNHRGDRGPTLYQDSSYQHLQPRHEVESHDYQEQSDYKYIAENILLPSALQSCGHELKTIIVSQIQNDCEHLNTILPVLNPLAEQLPVLNPLAEQLPVLNPIARQLASDFHDANYSGKRNAIYSDHAVCNNKSLKDSGVNNYGEECLHTRTSLTGQVIEYGNITADSNSHLISNTTNCDEEGDTAQMDAHLVDQKLSNSDRSEKAASNKDQPSTDSVYYPVHDSEDIGSSTPNIFCLTRDNYLQILGAYANPNLKGTGLPEKTPNAADTLVSKSSQNLYTNYSEEPILDVYIPRPEIYPMA